MAFDWIFQIFLINFYQPHDWGLDGAGEGACLCLTGEQPEGGLVLNRCEKKSRKLGAKPWLTPNVCIYRSKQFVFWIVLYD